MAARSRRGIDQAPVWQVALGILIAIYLVIPALIVIPMSFDGGITFQFPPTKPSVSQYVTFFTDPVWLRSLGNSLLVATLAALLATTVGTAAAIGLHSLTGRLAQFARTVLMISLVTPAIVIAVAVYISFLQWRMVGSLAGYVLAHAAIGVPFVLVTVTAALSGFDSRMLRASASLGASPIRTFAQVTLPLISRGIITGAIFAFVTSFDEVVIALFIRSPLFQTLPVQMYNSVTAEIDPTISAASSIVIVVATIVVLLPQVIRRPRRRTTS